MNKHPEYLLQCAIVEYLYGAGALFCASIAGSVKMTIMQWSRAKKAGYSAGFPDIIIFEARGVWHGMTVEVKAPQGVRSPAQKLWAADLRKRGYYAVTVWSMNEFVSEYKKYMQGASV